MITVSTEPLLEYIRSNWDASVRGGEPEKPASTAGTAEPYWEGGNTDSNMLAVPFRHTVPSPSGNFKALFYWDTYFTNLGLLRTDRLDLAKSNCNAFAWLVDRLGFIPNSVFKGDDNRSQPPYFSQMVQEVYERSQDKIWLKSILPRMETEYAWWMKERSWSDGLNRHGHQATQEYLDKFYDWVAVGRLKSPKIVPETIRLQVASHLLAEAEGGHDFTPVNDHRCGDLAHLHLNSILWQMERNISFAHDEIGSSPETVLSWKEKSLQRGKLIHAHLWDEKRGLFFNWDEIYHHRTTIASLETFAPLYFGLATEEQASRVRENLSLFETNHGVAYSENREEAKGFQWAWPVSWPPSTWLCVAGLARYGFHEDARRVSEKFLTVMLRFFREDGNLWEKYDATTGKAHHGEYKADPMLGWCAGISVACAEYLRTGKTGIP